MLEIKAGLSAVKGSLKDNEVHLGDARELLPRIEPGSVALSFLVAALLCGQVLRKASFV